MFGRIWQLASASPKCNIVTMTARRPSSRRIALLAALIVFVQALALGHAAAHADEPHDHYGVTCDLSAVAHVQAVIPVVDPGPVRLPDAVPLIAATGAAPVWIRPPGRAPPPRSPPTLHQ